MACNKQNGRLKHVMSIPKLLSLQQYCLSWRAYNEIYAPPYYTYKYTKRLAVCINKHNIATLDLFIQRLPHTLTSHPVKHKGIHATHTSILCLVLLGVLLGRHGGTAVGVVVLLEAGLEVALAHGVLRLAVGQGHDVGPVREHQAAVRGARIVGALRVRGVVQLLRGEVR